MKDVNKKEIITVDMIEKDVKTLCKFQVIYDLFSISLVVALLSPILFFNKIEGVTAIFMVVFLFVVFWFSCDMFVHLKIFVNMKKKNYKIDVDTLVEKKHIGEEYYNPFKPKVHLIFDTPNIFYFSKYKKHRIPTGKNYSFSQSYCMNSDGIYRSANIGDEFYLIILNKKILQIYNKNFFDFKR